MAKFRENHLIEELVCHLAPLADNIIPAALKKRSTAALLGCVELALTKALARPIKG